MKWNIQALPLGCIDSARTRPLNVPLSAGLRMTMRVLYGWPFAVPETKYSFALYLKCAMSSPGLSSISDSNILPGPVTSAEIAGSVTATGLSGSVTCGPPPRPPPRPPAAP